MLADHDGDTLVCLIEHAIHNSTVDYRRTISAGTRMHGLRLMVSLCALTFGAGCSHPMQSRPSETAERQQSAHCDIAAAALRAVVRSFNEQPLGLEKECVEKRAMRDGKIYVDVRFTKGDQLEDVGVPTCQRDKYFIRFGWKSFVPSPTGQVVLLLLLRQSDRELSFNAVTESSDWPSRRPGVFGLSQCGSSFGHVQLENGQWRAVVTNPPESDE